MKLKVVALAVQPASANGAQKTSAVARELARRSTESGCASQVFEDERQTCARASKDERYGSGLNERWGATEKRGRQSLRVRFGNPCFARDGFSERFNADGCRMRVGNEVALQTARQTTCIAAVIVRGWRIAVACGNDGGVRERRGVVMMRQGDK
jgi:hypothetical protein